MGQRRSNKRIFKNFKQIESKNMTQNYEIQQKQCLEKKCITLHLEKQKEI